MPSACIARPCRANHVVTRQFAARGRRPRRGFTDEVFITTRIANVANDGGDSDSTGSLTGRILGTALGAEVIPARGLADLELRDVLERMASDLLAIRTETLDGLSHR